MDEGMSLKCLQPVLLYQSAASSVRHLLEWAKPLKVLSGVL